MLPLTFRKRTINAQQLAFIQNTVNEHWHQGLKQISKILCRKWNWRQPNGRLKDMACREVLLTLSRKGLLRLPPRIKPANNDKRNRNLAPLTIDQSPMPCKLSQLKSAKLVLVRSSPLNRLYNSLIEHYHYLGYRQIVGCHLKYIAFIHGRPQPVWDGAQLPGPFNPAMPLSVRVKKTKKKTYIFWPIIPAF